MLKKALFVSALALSFGAASAASCEVQLEGTDAMTYIYNGKTVTKTTEIVVPASCKEFTMKLKHTGKMPAKTMGHNIVVAKASDIAGIVKDGAKAKDTDYLKPNDARVVAHSKMIGGGEETSVKFDVAKIKGGQFDFFCSYPAHQAKMRGKLVVK